MELATVPIYSVLDLDGDGHLDFVVTDSSPVAVFYLLQEQLDQVAGGARGQVRLR